MSEENLYTFENESYRKTYWHTCSHVLAQAVKRLHPEVKLAIGPAIDNGFYYDFDAPFNFTQQMLDELEAIVDAGTKINIDYFLNEILEEDRQEELIQYFRTCEEDDLEAAIDEFGGEYSEEEIRLVRIKFLSEMGN